MAKFFEGAHLWQAVRILAACALAYVAARLIGLSEFYWALVTAVVVTQPALPETLAAGRDRALGTLIGALAGLAVIAAGQQGGFDLRAVLGCAGSARDIDGHETHSSPILRHPRHRGSRAGAGKLARPFERVVEILVGVLASIVVSAVTPGRQRI